MTVIGNSNTPQRGLKPTSREVEMKPYLEVAEGMETQFASHMIEQMRKTIPRENETSSAQAYYESMMDYEYSKSLAKSDTGIGLKKIVLDQILPAHLKAPTHPAQAHAAYQVPALPAKASNVKGVDE